VAHLAETIRLQLRGQPRRCAYKRYARTTFPFDPLREPPCTILNRYPPSVKRSCLCAVSERRGNGFDRFAHLRRPKNKASLTANWQATDRLSLSATLLYVGSWWDISRQAEPPDGFSPLVNAPGYTTVNLAANYALRDDVTLFGRIDNLFNKQYEDPIDFMHTGFGAYAGIRLTTGGGASSGGPPPIAPVNPTPRGAGAT
jgi:hypothetical protein